jgi:hypothetical protein
MGTIQHEVVIATTFSREEASFISLWIKEKQYQNMFVITPERINGHITIFCGPDGSKEGWDESGLGDKIRKEFKEKLDPAYWHWIEVGYGEINYEIIDTDR